MNKTNYIILSIVLCFSLVFVVYPTIAYASCGFFCQIANAISAIVTAVVNVVVAIVTAVVNVVVAIVTAVVNVVQSIFTPAAQPSPTQPSSQPQYSCTKYICQ